MRGKLLLGVALTVMVAGGAFAQSGSRSSGNYRASSGSSSRSNTSAIAKKNARMQAQEESKVVREIIKADFSEIKLTREQKQTLASLVHDNFQQIKSYETQIFSAVPASETKALNKAYRIAIKGGQSMSEAMASSMVSVGIDEMIQKKVNGFSSSREELIQGIRDGLTETLDDEQKAVLAKAMMEKKEGEMADKEMMEKKDGEMADKEMMEKKDGEMAKEDDMASN